MISYNDILDYSVSFGQNNVLLSRDFRLSQVHELFPIFFLTSQMHFVVVKILQEKRK
jgi:hypothetical protein